MKLLVRNLTRTLGVNDIKKAFEKHGTVSDCVVVKDQKTNQSKGFGFVEMPNEEEALNAIKALHMTKLGTKSIRVKNADEKA